MRSYTNVRGPGLAVLWADWLFKRHVRERVMESGGDDYPTVGLQWWHRRRLVLMYGLRLW